MSTESQKITIIQLVLASQDPNVLGKIEKLLQAQSAVGTAGHEAPVPTKSRKKRQYGFAKGLTSFVAPDFDETPPGFEDYMPQGQ